ncbi:unnamed protein product [Pieris macdunnoughi]|uniref:DH domain-containing protein n=1 Tax=Pieris macdunnoughi TaxID=345717 RepID=A0A821W4D1_9NEOP|nr:unnamed protein product [Pieris macdunnoughi]
MALKPCDFGDDEEGRELEKSRKEYVQVLRDLRKQHPEEDIETVERMALETLMAKGPKSRAFYRVAATRKMTGGESEVPDNVVRKLMSPRQQVFMELLQTESNYVGILQTIVAMFKQPLEEMAEEDTNNGKNQALLNNTELKIIFGSLPPIFELHQ